MIIRFIRLCRRFLSRYGAGASLLFLLAGRANSYSVLSHEAMVDALWDSALQPIISARYPGTTPEQMKDAHAYAYGGSIIQDMGFYPQGNGYFSDLTHYVRTGDLIGALIADASTPNDLAFALGALSHYSGDCDGHRQGTNVSEPILYPNLEKKYGSSVNYEADPGKHLRTEFGFDVLEVARGNYAPEAYHNFIGFKVDTPLLERAFRETYNFELSSLFDDLPTAVSSYRRTVSNIIPLATRVAWAQHKDKIQLAQPSITRRRFLFVMKRSSFERYWGNQYDSPSLGDRILAFFIKLLPPVGPLRALHYPPFTPPVEQAFMSSLTEAITRYRGQVNAVRSGSLRLENVNFDVGGVTAPTQYGLQDETYAYWLDQLAHSHFANLTPAVRDTIVKYYANLTLPFKTKRKPKQWKILLLQLSELRSAPVVEKVTAPSQSAQGRAE